MKFVLIGAVVFVVSMTAAIARAAVHVLEDDLPWVDDDDLAWD
jgi:opacity protein-like surface antigen